MAITGYFDSMFGFSGIIFPRPIMLGGWVESQQERERKRKREIIHTRKFELCITISKEYYYQNQWEENFYELEV